MFKIGDFSRLSQVSVKALRYYDELGLLKPVQIDPFTGYRYYSADQLGRLNRILVLKDLGFSLEQIGGILDGDLSPAEMRGMLRLRRAELEQQVQEEQARLVRIEARLRQIEQEDTIPAYDVVIKHSERQMVASVRDTVPTYGDMGRLFGKIFAQLGQVRPAGPVLAIYHDGEYREQDADVEAAVPITAALPVQQPVMIRELPEEKTLASVIHQGSYGTLSQAYAALMNWIGANGYRINGPNREIYLRGPEHGGDPASYVTEVQFPIEKA